MYMQWTPFAVAPHTGTANTQTTVTATTDVLDDGQAYEIVVEMPGVTRDDLQIDLQGNVLVALGKRSAYPDGHKLLYDGRNARRTIEKRFTLGDDVARDQVSASLENGLLRIRLPRKSEERLRRIQVETA